VEAHTIARAIDATLVTPRSDDTRYRVVDLPAEADDEFGAVALRDAHFALGPHPARPVAW